MMYKANMTKPVLYSFRRCPYAMRARLAIMSSQISVDLREVVLRDKPPEMLEISPKGTVPVLQLPDGSVIEESIDVMNWAISQNDPENWASSKDTDLIAENDGPFKQALDHYKYPSRYDLSDDYDPRSNGLAFLQKLDGILASQSYLSGDKSGFTDNAIFPFIRQFSNVDKDWFTAQSLDHLKPWLEMHLTSDIFLSIMQKYPQWKSGEDAVTFPN